MRKSNAVNDDWLINIGRREPNRLSLIQCHGDHVTPHGIKRTFSTVLRMFASRFRYFSRFLLIYIRMQRNMSKDYLFSCFRSLRFTGCNRGQLTGDNILLHAASRCHNITHLDASWTNVNDNGVASVAEASDK